MYDPVTEKNEFEELVALWRKGVDQMPEVLKTKVEDSLKKLQEMVLERRPPRVLILGRRGAGKSSLINAIFKRRVAAIGSLLSTTGKAQWHSYHSPTGSVEILDTRGLADRTRPESAGHADALDDIRDALQDKIPDVILFLCKAKEVDAHIEDDVSATLSIQAHVQDSHDYCPPIVGLMTQVDEIDPKRVEPPYNHPGKKELIDLACVTLRDAFAEQQCELEKIIPVSAYAEYEGTVLTYSNSWNIDTLVEYLIEVLPQSARLMMARSARVKAFQRRLAQEIVTATTVVCAGIAAIPIPVADALPLTAAQISMIAGIGFVSGRTMSKKTAGEFASAMGVNLGAAFVFRELARALVKLVPGVGSVISSAVAASVTWALGQAAIRYFIDGATADQAKEFMKQARRKAESGEVKLPTDSSTAA